MKAVTIEIAHLDSTFLKFQEKEVLKQEAMNKIIISAKRLTKNDRTKSRNREARNETRNVEFEK